jgi:hypothetical protein
LYGNCFAAETLYVSAFTRQRVGSRINRRATIVQFFPMKSSG